ncbi:APC family permease [Gordonia sp. NPDC003376]
MTELGSNPPGTQPAVAPGDVPGFHRTLTAPRVTMLVVAAAAPLGVMIGNIPIGIILGNGAGLPVMFLVAGVLVALLATGYLALSARVDGPGGFSVLVGAGLGPALGLGTAFATGLAYLAGTVALAVATGYYSNLILGGFGIDLPWWGWSAIALALVLTLGRRAATVSARALLGLMIAEFAVVGILDVAILVNHGFSAFPLTTFSPSTVLSGSIGPAIMMGFTSYIGIESAILYKSEAKDPHRSIPRATYCAVSVIIVIYLLSSWLIIGAVGADQAVPMATEMSGDFVFAIAADNGGDPLLVLMQVFFCTSLLACLLALHNATVRYVQALGQQRFLPRALGRIHTKHGAPSIASDVVVASTAVVLLGCALTGADPYLSIGTSLTGIFTIGVIGVQVLVALSVIRYFRGDPDRKRWATLWAPAIGGIGILLGVIAIALNYHVLTGSDSPLINSLPVVIPLALVVGVAVARRRERRGEVVDLDSLSE